MFPRICRSPVIEMLPPILFLDVATNATRPFEAVSEMVFRILVLAAAGCTLKLNCALLAVPLACLSVLAWFFKFSGTRRRWARMGVSNT